MKINNHYYYYNDNLLNQIIEYNKFLKDNYYTMSELKKMFNESFIKTLKLIPDLQLDNPFNNYTCVSFYLKTKIPSNNEYNDFLSTLPVIRILTEDEKDEIRHSKTSTKTLSIKYGVSPSTIYKYKYKGKKKKIMNKFKNK